MSWVSLQLPVGLKENLPPLLVSSIFSIQTYTIYITDLTYIWSESLDRRGVIKRGLDEDTSIDPSEDADQMRQLLERLKLGLAGGKKTTLGLEAGTRMKDGDAVEELTLTITAELPAGIRPLQWPVKLRIRSQDVLATQLTLPVIQSYQARLDEVDNLVGKLKEKDHVIQKLVDKIETMGAELGHIFAGAAPKRGATVSRKWQEERVPGLGPFDLDTWRNAKTLKATEYDGNKVANTINAVFGSGKDGLQNASGSEDYQAAGSWWTGLDDLVQAQRAAEIVPKASSELPALSKESTSVVDEDEFQVQSTPPHLMDGTGNHKTLSKKPLSGNSSDDEDDLDGGVNSQNSLVPDSYIPPPKPTSAKKLGTISSKSKVIEKANTPASPPEQVSTGINDDTDTATEDEDHGEAVEKQNPPPPLPRRSPPPAAKMKKGGLGMIGGKRKDPAPLPVEPEETQEVTLPERTSQHKLGMIGHKKTPIATAKQKESPVKKEKSESPEAEETAEEKANKKREQLKRELEEKAKIPVKKKRKF